MYDFKNVITIFLFLSINCGCTKQVPIDILKSGVANWNMSGFELMVIFRPENRVTLFRRR